MKYNNINKELDNLAEILLNPQQNFYIWGAGIAGKNFLQHFNLLKIHIKGFIDSDKEKIGTRIENLYIYSEDVLKEDIKAIIIVATLDFVEEIEKSLIKLGKEENKSFFYSNVFLSIYKMYSEEKLYMHHLNVHITDRCTLKCQDCSVFMGCRNNPQDIGLNEIKLNIDLYFRWVDFVQELHLIGGEPLMNHDLIEIVEYIGSRYRNNICEFAIATNGTILPSQELIKVCRKYNVFFTISDYSQSSVFYKRNKVNQICKLLNNNYVFYRLSDKSIWLDFGNPKRCLHLNENILREKFTTCFFRNRVMYKNKLYYCHRQVAAIWSNLTNDDEEAFFNMEHNVNKRTLMQFDLGYNQKGYLDFCNYCNGYERVNKNFIKAAKQIDLKVLNYD